MKLNFIIFFFLGLLVSCKSQELDININPKLKLIDKQTVKFENQILKYSQLDSILREYLKVIPPELKDSIRINLEVNTKIVTIQKVSDVKISLRRNKLHKINYKPINDER